MVRNALAQRFGSSLNLNPHLHLLMLEGVYVGGEEELVFVAAPTLSDQDLQQIVRTSARRIIRLCTTHGLLDDTQVDRLADEDPRFNSNGHITSHIQGIALSEAVYPRGLSRALT